MDTEETNELAENDLARILRGWKESLAAHTGLLAAVGIGLVVLLGGYLVVQSRAESRRQAAWQQLANAEESQGYAAVAEDFAGSEAAVWARLREGRSHLEEGMRRMFTDRSQGVGLLEQAIAAAKDVSDAPEATYQAREQAMLMNATAVEALSGDDIAPAISAYEKFITEFPNSLQRGFAEQRLADLNNPETQQFYAWFSKQNPEPLAPLEPDDGLGRDIDVPPIPDVPNADAPAENAGDVAAEMKNPGTENPGTENADTENAAADADATTETTAAEETATEETATDNTGGGSE